MKFFILLALLHQEPSFDSVKGELARWESDGGQNKVHVNVNMTIDCGLYQINSRHFVSRDDVGLAFDSIFVSYGVGVKLHERVVAAITNDRLNEDLARKLYRLRGLKSWTSYKKRH